MLLLIAIRSLLQHRLRTFLLGGVIALVTALLLTLTGISKGMQDTMVTAATTLMTGHVNVAGFYKVTAGQSAPVVTDYKRVLEHVKKTVPELDYVAQRGRGWSKLISDTSSIQVGISGIDITQETGFKKVVVAQQGNIEDMAKPGSVLLFESQAKKLGAKVGDQLTFSAPTERGTNNTLDVTVAVVANDIGMLSSWSVFLNDVSLRKLYQLNEGTTGALQLYLKDLKDVKPVQERLRKSLAADGWALMDEDPTMFWMKFPKVNRENWTGQKLDITNWEDEVSFMKWIVSLMSALSVLVTGILVIIICVGIMNIMWITIRERTREIGTLRAIGMQRSVVLRMFVTEGFLMGLFGTSLGTLIGLVAALAINSAKIAVPVGAQLFLLNDRLVITPSVFWVIFAIAFITFCITAVSVIPSYLAARMKPITAMHHIG